MVRHGKALLAVDGTGVSVSPATETEGPALRRLMQLYCYDFNDFSNMPIHGDGTFGDPEFIEGQFGPRHTTYVLRFGGTLAGFAIVSPRSYLTGKSSVTDMAQFFVMRGYRRKGIGRTAVTNLFDRHPGAWEVRVIDENSVANAFWRSAIDGYTSGAFEVSKIEDRNDSGTLFSFTSRGEGQGGRANQPS